MFLYFVQNPQQEAQSRRNPGSASWEDLKRNNPFSSRDAEAVATGGAHGSAEPVVEAWDARRMFDAFAPATSYERQLSDAGEVASQSPPSPSIAE